MSFLFKKNKPAALPPTSGLPPASRPIHTSDGTPASVKQPLSASQNDDRKAQSPPPNTSAGANSSLDSLTKIGATTPQQQAGQAPPNPQAPFARRDRSGSELGARPQQQQMRPPPHADLYPWSQKPLNFQNPQANPFPRYGAAVNSIASKEGYIYLMGGLINGETVKGDLWMVEAATSTGPQGQLSCYPIATVSEGPGPRVGHASLLVGNAFIVFGGDTQQEDTDVLDDTLYLLNTTSRQWSRASPPGRRPAGRYGHTLNILGSKIYIFGGQVEGAFYNDLIAFDLNALQNPNNTWEFLTPNTNGQPSGSLPPARTNHTMISYQDTLYLFGGTDGQQWFNDVWTFDPKTNKWTMLDCIGYIPAPREGHSAALVKDVMYIFGGRTEHGDDLGDLAAFRISLRRWYTFQNMGPSPSPRSGHSMTAYGQQIVVLAGEPSTAPRDPAELSMAYILDTAKIRYPNDAPASQIKGEKPSSPPPQNAGQVVPAGAAAARSVSRDGPGPYPSNEFPRDAINGGPVQRPEQQQLQQQQQQQRGPLPAQGPGPVPAPVPVLGQRASVGPGYNPTGPPPQGQAPNPRLNGVPPPNNNLRGKPEAVVPEQMPRPAGASLEQQRQGPPLQAQQISSALPVRTDSRGDSRPNREQSPGSQGRRTPQSTAKAKAMEAGEAAPLVGAAVARSRSHRSQRAHASVDGSEEGLLRSASGRSHVDHRHSKSFAEEPHSPNITPHHEALMKELESVKSKNAWYASELALARKSGYTASQSPTVDDRATMNFADDDRPLIEAFMTMRNELMKMQQNMEQQSKLTAQKIAEVEHQRDAAVTEAAYARAKLAAHGGSQRSTPQLDSARDGDDAERSTDISRRLALSLAATSEHKAKLEQLHHDLDSERKAREAAEEAAEAAQNRFEELSGSRNPGEIEGLKAELHDAESFARAEAGRRSELEQKLSMLEVDHRELQEKHGDVSGQVSTHLASLAALEAAVAASTTKAATIERQLDEERQNRENVERKLASLRSEHEEKVTELDSTSRKLRDVEELADNHAREANTHREALMAGLAKISRPDPAVARDVGQEERVTALQAAVEEANKLVKANEQAAEIATQKLRGAEERIAGLEAYQEQSSREGLGVRRQLQAALRELRDHETQNRDLKAQVETHQRNASALSVQHGALKDLLGERGVDMSTSRRSPGFDSGSRNGTPDLARVRDLEQQLQATQRSHEDTKSMFEAREQEAEKAYRERLEQLENDYQSLLTYVKGTEKMLKKMKEELTRYKSSNQKLQTELDATRDGKRSVSSNATDAADWANERDAMQSAISEMKLQMTSHIQTLEQNMSMVKADLEKAQFERDQQKASHDELSRSLDRREKEMTELKTVNSRLESRALDAEHRVTVLLDQVGSSVNNYRRQSQLAGQNGVRTSVQGHNQVRAASPSGTADSASVVGDHDEARSSMALNDLASELETLKAQWESQSRSYRLSDKFDFERTPTKDLHQRQPSSGHDLSHTLSKWRSQEDDDTPTVEKTQAAATTPATIAAKAAVSNTAAA